MYTFTYAYKHTPHMHRHETQASLMGDTPSFRAISAAQTPQEVKSLGRYVSPWNEPLWQSCVSAVAKHVVFAKFSSVPGLSRWKFSKVRFLLGFSCDLMIVLTLENFCQAPARDGRNAHRRSSFQ